jgi:hypothetical protein
MNAQLWFLLPTTIVACLAIISQAVMYFRWTRRSIQQSERQKIKDDVQHKFVSDVAQNHLPHIYRALELMCRKMEIELDDPPPIRWIDFNGKK